MNKRKLLLIFTALVMAVILPLSAYADSEVVLDVTTRKVYQPIEANEILKAYRNSPEDASGSYDGRNLAVTGKVTGIDSKGMVLKLGPASGSSGTTISCNIGDADGKGSVSVGDLVQVLGTVKISYRLISSLKMTADKVERVNSASVDTGIYVTAGGAWIDPDNLLERAIGEGNFMYSIPRSFAEAEYELPNVSGFQYKLNELTGDGDIESLFVFYVDAELLENRGDITKTTKVQKAIVHNILGSTKSIRRRLIPFLARDVDMVTLETDYATFVNYSGHYLDPNGIDHRVEFMFLPSEGDDYIRCLLYVYTGEHNFSDEILLLMRCMDI